MKRKPMGSLTAITLRMGALVLGIWFLPMSLLTLGTALYVFRDVQEQGLKLAESAGKMSQIDSYYDDFQENLQTAKAVPGFLEHEMLRSVKNANVKVLTPSLWLEKGESWSIYGSKSVDCHVALAFVDGENQVLHQSEDFLTFEYVTEATWLSGEDGLRDGYAWLDLSNPKDERYQMLRNIYGGTGLLDSVYGFRLTGTFDGSRFEPYAMAMLDYTAYHHAIGGQVSEPTQEEAAQVQTDSNCASTSGYGTGFASGNTLAELDSLGRVEWQQMFDNTVQADPDVELVTIYGKFPSMMVYDKGDPVDYKGATYSNLLDLLLKNATYSDEGCTIYSGFCQENLWNTVVLSAQSYTDFSDGYDFVSEEDVPKPDFILIAAVQASPLKIAMVFLRKVYLVTGLFSLVGFLLVRHSIRKHLLRPLKEINQTMAAHWSRLPTLETSPPKWREPRLLSRQYIEIYDQLQKDKNELARLNTALDYARTAEEKRRQMISYLTHQLKTPLAVIHGYAEGLREHIAEEKRDHYVEMILTETERSDKMVLEMLDLSRLEAGKVKLSRDQVSLKAVAQYVLDKLERPIAEKQLQVKFLTQEEGEFTADESRMAQVVENFCTNAVKYTPQGGWIRVRIQKDGPEVTFTMENASLPMSKEELSKVWDPFYRTEDAQTEEGTGLGLAIVKSIVELHGGKCFARNLDQGVSFGFRIPQ